MFYVIDYDQVRNCIFNLWEVMVLYKVMLCQIS